MIATRFGVGVRLILSANNIQNPDLLPVWQNLVIPPPIVRSQGTSFTMIPDSELIYGPASGLFNLHGEISRRKVFLMHYREDVEGRGLSGEAILQLVAQRYSVNPRLLLAILEYQSGWLTRADIPTHQANYPIGFVRSGWEGLFAQLSYAANELNRGYYLWRAGWIGPFVFNDGSVVIPGSGVNAGTVGVQHLFSQLYSADEWREVVQDTGFYQTYVDLFGNPFAFAVEPLTPIDLHQPRMQLPFEEGQTWSFTAGPHSAWDTGGAWAALDFAPPGYALGCVQSNEWVVAIADGVVLRADQGEVILDLDGDGYEQTGWVLLYLHVESRDRVQAGASLRAGDRVGHPSCEGGVSSGTHVHLARKYNGEWIAADGPLPFNLDGWISAGKGIQYNGTLSKGSDIIEAYYRRGPYNQISR
jgi:murein DD-endopeptidase MepM/ murein hydrolase activator NlpD